tara:strand:- start:186 stop:332 length:147 start_codon:yes stop_codon:yes gene_type:complete
MPIKPRRAPYDLALLQKPGRPVAWYNVVLLIVFFVVLGYVSFHFFGPK